MIETRVRAKELLVQTVQGDVIALSVDRDETLASFKKRLQNIGIWNLEKATLESLNGSLRIPLGEYSDREDTGISSPQLHASGRLRDFPNGVPVLLKEASVPELKHRRSLSSPNLSPAGQMGALEFSESEESDSSSSTNHSNGGAIQFIGTGGNRRKLLRMQQQIRSGFESGMVPQALTEGLGGCYVFSSDTGKKIAVVKPTDEEPLAPNNPKGFVGRSLGEPGLKPTVRVGEAAVREAAAYLLDQGFAKVPCTSLARMSCRGFNYNDERRVTKTKLVSVQEFVEHQYDASDVGTAMFPVDAVHRIGILDIRLFNTDRHSGNILVARKNAAFPGVVPGEGSPSSSKMGFSLPSVDLVPIDHGFCLPETLETVYFEWLHWPQASMPFSSMELEYIARLDHRSDIAMLNRELPMLRVQSLRILEISTGLLKMCASSGLNLAEIGSVMSKPLAGFDDEPSELERLCVLAKEEVMFSYSINKRFSLRPGDDGRVDGLDDSDFDEDSMFEMDDILSPAQVSHQSSSSRASSYKSDSPKQQMGGEGAPSFKPLKLFREEYAGSDGSGPSTPRSPRMHISRRHSTRIGGTDTSPWLAAAASVSHGAAIHQRYSNHGGKAGLPSTKPINCDMPSSELKDLFSNMDADMWRQFCDVLFSEIGIALEGGDWKHVSSEGNQKMLHLGTSCPDF